MTYKHLLLKATSLRFKRLNQPLNLHKQNLNSPSENQAMAK